MHSTPEREEDIVTPESEAPKATPEELHEKWVSETLKKNPELIEDKKWRMDNLYYIITKKGEKNLFRMNKAQADFFELSKRFYRFIILKSRQLGFTTFIVLWIFDEILFNKNKEAAIIAHTKDDAVEIFDRKVAFARNNLPGSIKFALAITTDSAKKLKITRKDGSTSTFLVTNSARSGTFHYVHATELAELFIKYPKKALEFVKGTIPAIPMDGGRLFIESTANGMAGYFYDTFTEGYKMRDDFTRGMSKAIPYPVFYNWQWDEMDMEAVDEDIPVDKMQVNSDIDWAGYKAEHNLSDREITYYYLKWLSLKRDVNSLRQQYPTTAEEAFGASGRTYFSQSRMYDFYQNVHGYERFKVVDDRDTQKPILIPDPKGPLYVWKKLQPNKKYVIGGDVAEGLADGDWSVLSIVDEETHDLVGIYHCHEEPYDFAHSANRVGRIYNNALLAIESNKDGLYVNDTLLRMSYPNLYYREEQDDAVKAISRKVGWRTTSITRPYALAAMNTAFNNQDYWVHKILLEEMLAFLRNSRDKPEALAGKHDDIVMATSIAYGVLENKPKKDEKNDKPKDNSYLAWVYGEIEFHELPIELQNKLTNTENYDNINKY